MGGDGAVVNQGGRGARAENAVRDELGKLGYDVIRAAGSKGAADLWAIHDAEILFVQVKICPEGESYTQLSPEERSELFRLALRVRNGGYPIVAQVHPGAGSRPMEIRWYELYSTGSGDRRPWIPMGADPR